MYSKIRKVWSTEFPQLLVFAASSLKRLWQFIVWHTIGFLIWIIDGVLCRFMFTEKGLPRNPASTEKGHRPWLKKCQGRIATMIVRLRGKKPAIIGRKEQGTVSYPQPQLREV